MSKKPIQALQIPSQQGASIYPEPFKALVAGRTKHKLGDYFGLSNFGVNLTELAPNSMSALAHHHSKQDEFIYMLEGEATLKLDDETHHLKAGDCMGFAKGKGIAHQLINTSNNIVRYLEIGDRTLGDSVVYPDDDIAAHFDEKEGWQFTHKDGSAY